jgi:hypothetical protein
MNSVVDYVNTYRDPVEFGTGGLYKVYISNQGSDATGDGTEANPYATTEKAVYELMDLEFSQGVFLRLIYDTGTYYVNDIIKHVEKLNSYGSYWVALQGTPIITDSINVTHAGTGNASYFRWTTDSTIVGDRSLQFIGRTINVNHGGAVGYPIVENTDSSFISPAPSTLTGDDRFFFTLGTKFQVDQHTSMRMDHGHFFNIEFTQTDSLDSYTFMGSEFLSFANCKFTSSQPSYDMIELERVDYSTTTSCIFDWYTTSGSGDIWEVNHGGHDISFSYFHSETAYAVQNGGAAIETRPGCHHVEVYHCAIKGIADGIKNDGATLMSLGSMYIDSCENAFLLYDPRRQIWGESDYSVWAAGYDSIVCKDVDYLFNFNDLYDAGKSIYLPHLKAGGYTSFHPDAKFKNNTLDLNYLSEFAVGGDDNAIHTLIVDTLKTVPPHASMAFDDETETLTMNQNVWTKFTNATDDLFATVDASGITEAGDSLTVIAPGDYMLNASISFSGTTNSDVYEFALFKNDVLASPKMERTTTSADIGAISLMYYLEDLVAGDDLCLKIRNTANDFDATLVACSWVTWLLHHQ